MAVRAVIDTNVWVSSILNPTGRPAMLRKAFEEGAFHVIISEPLLEEITDVLSRPKIKSRYALTDDDIEELLTLLEEHTEYALLSDDVNICSDKDDDFVIETAIKGKAEYLVTGDGDIKLDKDVSAFLSKYGVTVISIANFLNLIEKAWFYNSFTINHIERGVRSPSFEVLERLAKALNIEVLELFNFSNRPFLKNKCHLELIELLNYLASKKPKEIEMVRGIAKLILEQDKH